MTDLTRRALLGAMLAVPAVTLSPAPGIGQSWRPGFGPSRSTGLRYFAQAVSYDPDATAAFARMAVEPSPAQKKRISDFIIAWKASGKWATDDALWLHAAHTAQAALINLKGNAAYDCVPVNAPVFRTYGGYMPDGSTSYLSTGFNPGTVVGANFVKNTGSLWVRSNTDNQNVGSLAGWYDSGLNGGSGTTINPRSTNSEAGYRLNNSVNLGNPVGVTVANSVGMYITNRTSASAVQLYKNGVAITTASSAAADMTTTGAFRLGSIGPSYRNCEFSAGGIGAGFASDAQALACHNALAAYLQALRTEEGVTIA